MPACLLAARRRHRLLVWRFSLGVLPLALAACAVGPDYQPPRPATPAAFAQAGGKPGPGASSVALASQPNPAWWRSFNDPQLDGLIERAIAGNLTLQQAVLRIAGAREQTVQAGAAGLPSVNASVKATRQQLGLKGELDSSAVGGGGEDTNPEIASGLDSLFKPVNLYQGSFDASWEIDLWGRVRRSVEAANAQTQAAVEGRNDALVSLEAEVARTYLQLRGAQSVAAALETQIAVAQQSMELTRSRQRNGLAPQYDVENANAQLGSLRAQLPQYEAQQRQAMNGLAVLLGQPPGALDGELAQARPLPAMPAAVPVGIPSTLARRRPDIRQAEANLHAATANIGVSVAQLFPDVSLTGQFGMRNTDADYLTRWSSHFYSFGPQISLPIFQGGRLVASVKLSRVQQANQALAYRQTVLTALQDVENALVSYRTDRQRVDGLDQTAASLQNAFDLASESYRQGISSFINVLDAQRQLAQARQQAAGARVQTGTDLVSLYKALGGGWEPYQNITLPDYPVFGPAESGNTPVQLTNKSPKS
ncbi:efflux transporter outer membrane subunit [Acerihabitans arboris]|uniref:Efflux transporter outer membrane subunit n=1 Tax=Acerihabitans arboris TaxID=2691583 RepID=A0A845SG32_9GAMM|nr:efflux transporter outer membrane subunit [Acerihabitans arboris]NDL62829.1 efflux transporter outer membrane subunit [Acerihabitans arboris]